VEQPRAESGRPGICCTCLVSDMATRRRKRRFVTKGNHVDACCFEHVVWLSDGSPPPRLVQWDRVRKRVLEETQRRVRRRIHVHSALLRTLIHSIAIRTVSRTIASASHSKGILPPLLPSSSGVDPVGGPASTVDLSDGDRRDRSGHPNPPVRHRHVAHFAHHVPRLPRSWNAGTSSKNGDS